MTGVKRGRFPLFSYSDRISRGEAEKEEAMTEGFDNFCIVELFGHQKIAGKVTEQVIAGQGFVRVDVPQTKRFPAFTRMFGSGAIYSITPVDEETCK